MLNTVQINEIIKAFQKDYPLQPVANNTNKAKCGRYFIESKNNIFIIYAEDGETELASAVYKLQALAFIYAANAFPTLKENEQEFLKKNLPLDLVKHLEVIHRKKHPGGRPKTGRRYKQYWINDEEDEAIKQLLAEMRSKKKDC